MEFKSFATLSSARAAIKLAGLNGVAHFFETTLSGKIRPVFTPDLLEDREYLRWQGWDARKENRP